ncbi:MAG: non-ribosomal peptide synthetase, partial [Chloroflexi bacterium]
MLVVQNTPDGRELAQIPALAGVSVLPLEVERTTSKFDLTLFVAESEQGLHCQLEYSTDLFEEATITRLLAHFSTLLEGVVHNPHLPLPELPLLTEGEREQLLVQWNATQSDYPQDRCVHQLFEEQVELTPDAVALVFEDQMLTYAHLDGVANRLAHYLQEFLIGPESFFGVLMRRSVEMLIGVLSILKAGGTVVPIDPELPKARISYLLSDARITVLLTQHQLQALWQEQTVHLVVIERDWQVITQGPSTHSESQVQAENLCYVIYTSGSTGTPKGVGVPHRVLVNLLFWHCRHLLGGARTLQFAALSFDVSFYELFAAWCSGGMLFLVAEALRPDVAALACFLEERAIEKVILPVVILHQLAREMAVQQS